MRVVRCVTTRDHPGSLGSYCGRRIGWSSVSCTLKTIRCWRGCLSRSGHFGDGFKRSLALVPPVERRGLVLIDPSYEIKSDYTLVVNHIKELHKRFATGSYALWYPLVDEQRVRTLEKAFIKSGMGNIELYQLDITEDHSQPGMTGSGMILVNPPWTLKKDLREALEWFAPRVSDSGKPLYRLEVLVPE